MEAQQQLDLATLRKELGLLDLRLNDLLQRLGPDTPETVRDAIWPEVYGLVHLKAKTVDVYARKAKIYEQFFTLSEVSAVVQGLVAVIERLPLEPEERARAFHQCRAVIDLLTKTYHADQAPGSLTPHRISAGADLSGRFSRDEQSLICSSVLLCLTIS